MPSSVSTMKLVSIRLITDDPAGLVAFYQRVTGVTASWYTPDFAEIVTPLGTLAVGSSRTVGVFAPGSACAAANRTAIIEFLVADVDAEHHRLREVVPEIDFVNEPTTMPWGNRSLLLRDPDGTLVNLFTPVTDAAKAKFAAVL